MSAVEKKLSLGRHTAYAHYPGTENVGAASSTKKTLTINK